jgi:hypothetical protein
VLERIRQALVDRIRDAILAALDDGDGAPIVIA